MDLKARAARRLRFVALGGLALGACAVAWDEGSVADGLATLRTPLLPVVLAAYLLAHLLRVVRTLVVLGERTGSVRLVVLAHTSTSLWAALLPFKLGELVRLWAIGRATDGTGRGLAVVWVERTFDAALIGLAAGLALVLLPGSGETVLPVAVLAVALLGGTTLATSAVPENLGTAKTWLLARYTTDWSNRLLGLLDAAGDAIRSLRQMIRGKVATLVGLTLGIWGLETSGMALLLPSGPPLLPRLLVGMLAVLSGVLRPEGGVDEWMPVVAAWRGIVLASASLMSVGAVVGWEWARRRSAAVRGG